MRAARFAALLGIVGISSIHACMPAGASKFVEAFKETHVCLRINNRVQAYFTPETDRFTLLQINGCEMKFR